jgi:ABC-type phosphate transport system substrate-binding protein
MKFIYKIGRAAVGCSITLACHTVAADVVVVVSASSSVTALTAQQIAAIFLGNNARLPNGEPAVPIDQAEGSGTRDEFYAKFTGKSAAQMKAHWSKIIFTGRGQPPKELSAADIKKQLAVNPNAIAYLEKTMVDASVRVLN